MKSKKSELRKLYFKDEDSDLCSDLESHLKLAKQEGLSTITLLEAILDTITDMVWCGYYDAVEKSDCRKAFCSRYKPNKSGKGTCVHRGRLFLKGEEREFEISDYSF